MPERNQYSGRKGGMGAGKEPTVSAIGSTRGVTVIGREDLSKEEELHLIMKPHILVVYIYQKKKGHQMNGFSSDLEPCFIPSALEIL